MSLGVPSAADDSLAEAATALKNSLNAAGVAIAVESNGAIVCRAAAGDAAPEVGAHVSRSEGITGKCISTGAEIGCSDTDLDPSVNAAVCHELGIRSLISVPLHWNGEVVGVAVAMFAYPSAFDAAAVQLLKTGAQQIVSRVYGERSAGGHLDAAEREPSFGTGLAANAPRAFPANTESVRKMHVSAETASALPLTENPLQTEAQIDWLKNLRSAAHQDPAPVRADDAPDFVLLNSDVTSFDDVSEFLPRWYSVIVAVVIACLLVFIGLALKRPAERSPAPVGSPAAPAAVRSPSK